MEAISVADLEGGAAETEQDSVISCNKSHVFEKKEVCFHNITTRLDFKESYSLYV